VTPDAPTWAHVIAFLKADRWTQIDHGGKRDRHIFWEKLVNDRLLQTHTSHSTSTVVGANRFGVILREQLEVTRAQFWNTIRTGTPAPRPAPVEPPDVTPVPLWAVMRLRSARGMSEPEIAALGSDEAVRLATESFNDPV
jgi:hypothetical protein